MKLRALVFVCALALTMLTPSVIAGAAEAPRFYVSLGDSLAAGTQPDLSSPGQDRLFTDQSYTDQLFRHLRGRTPTLQHLKLGCPGETTATLRNGGLPYEGAGSDKLCRYTQGTQLAEAVAFLQAHQGAVVLVTIDIGANDVLNLGPAAGGAAIAANLPAILLGLRAVAGPAVPIVGMNYYDPRLVTWFANPATLPGEVAAAVAFNNFLESVYAALGVPVADVEQAYLTTNTTLVGGVPVDVRVICTLTWMCKVQNIHPNAFGYLVIAIAFEAKL